MRAIVNAKAFLEALKQLEKLPQKFGIPALRGILARFSDGCCSLTAMDLTTCLTVKLPSQGSNFSFVFPNPKAVLNACRYYDGELTIETCGVKLKSIMYLSRAYDTEPNFTQVDFFCGRRAGEFDILPAKDYPELPKQEEGVSFQANAANLLKRVERVKYAVREPAGSSYQAEQTCVQFSGNDVFCLDGWRASCDTDPALTFPKPFLTWGKSLSYLKLMGNQDVSVHLDAWNVWFSSEDVCLSCQQEGAEPFSLASAVPDTFREEFYVNTAEFLRELGYLKGFIQSKRSGCVRFCGGKMMLTDGSNRGGTEVQIDGHSKLTVGFSLRFMEDALKQFKGEEFVKIKLRSEIGPIIIEADGRNDFAMVLPVRLRETKAA